jgi:hypothetical protein
MATSKRSEDERAAEGRDNPEDWKDRGQEGLQDGDGGREPPAGLKRERNGPNDEKAQEWKR